MALQLALIKPLTQIVTKVMDKIAPDKLSQEARLRIETQAKQIIIDHADEFEKDMRSFFLEYEGAAKDLPRFVQILRGSLRTIITYVTFAMFFAVIGSWVFGWYTLPTGAEQGIKYVFYLTLVLASWWFGDRLINHSGIADLLKNIKK